MVARPYLVGQQEFAALYGVEPQMVPQWIHRGVLDPDTAAVISGVRYWPLGFAAAFGSSTPRPKLLLTKVVDQLKEEQEPGWMAYTKHELPPIVGQHEIVTLFRLPAQANLAVAMRAGRFTPPDWRLSGSPLWLLDTVLDAVPQLREGARSLSWEADEKVLTRLREGRYDGPGSVVLTRGRYARHERR